MPQYRVYERQVRLAEYWIEADSEAEARSHCEGLGADEYDAIELEETSIIYVEEVVDA